MQITCPNCQQQFNLNEDTKDKKEEKIFDKVYITALVPFAIFLFIIF